MPLCCLSPWTGLERAASEFGVGSFRAAGLDGHQEKRVARYLACTVLLALRGARKISNVLHQCGSDMARPWPFPNGPGAEGQKQKVDRSCVALHSKSSRRYHVTPWVRDFSSDDQRDERELGLLHEYSFVSIFQLLFAHVVSSLNRFAKMQNKGLREHKKIVKIVAVRYSSHHSTVQTLSATGRKVFCIA